MTKIEMTNDQAPMTNNKKSKLKVVIFCFFVCLIACPLFSAQANPGALPVKVFNKKLNVIRELNLVDENFKGVLDFALVDLGGDTLNELVVSYGYQSFPELKIYRYDGSVVNSWQPYPVGFEGKINVATADFDQDGRDEIVTIPGEGGGAQVRIFDGYGRTKFTKGFFADDQANRRGAEVAVGDVNGDGEKEIIVSLLQDHANVIKFFNKRGEEQFEPIIIPLDEVFAAMKVFAYDLTQNHKDELILGAGVGNQPFIRVLDYQGAELSSFNAYGSGFRGGIDVSAAQFNGQHVIVTAAGFSGGSHVRFFNLKGEPQVDPTFFAYDQAFRGGINVAVGKVEQGEEIIVIPQTVSQDADLTSATKVIKVDISEQRLYAYDRGRLIKTFLISSGTYGHDTPLGKFSVYKKRPLVRMSWYYGPDNPNNYDLPNVPHVLSFKGPYTLHGAYWHHNWGHRMSHGCVNISLPNAEWLYNWAPMGTTVIVEE